MWGSGRPELVLLHGGAQNAHTWDTVALALGRPLVAIDLPGHGHSDWRDDHDVLAAPSNADDVAVAVRELAPDAAAVVGMSLGGLTAVRARRRSTPSWCARLVIVDVTPGVDDVKADADHRLHLRARALRELRRDPRPHRRSSTRPARCRRCGAASCTTPIELTDGAWALALRPGAQLVGERTRHARLRRPLGRRSTRSTCRCCSCAAARRPSSATTTSPSCCGAGPRPRVVSVEGAGHSIQGDKPLELARLLQDFLDRLSRPQANSGRTCLPRSSIVCMTFRGGSCTG